MKQFIRLLSLCLCITMGMMVNAQNTNTIVETVFQDKVEIYLHFDFPGEAILKDINKFLSLDHQPVRDGKVYAYANRHTFSKFLTYALPYTVLPSPGELFKPDMRDESAGQMLPCSETWDAYPSYEDYLTLMYAFPAFYPDICALEYIGFTPNGREILALRISDNVQEDEDEPEFFYTSSMHGDETAGYPLMLRLIDHILCNYGSDQDLTALVDNIDIYINPLANPDGTYTDDNSTVAGATRSNANGYDLNRNYPDPQDGEHPDGGPYQAETEAFMAYEADHDFVLSCNFHGGAEVFNYPWDTWNAHPADLNWWECVGTDYADLCQEHSPSGYFDFFGDGVTNGFTWYEVDGGRQDYMNYYHRCRESTIELSDTKLLPSSQFDMMWEANYRSLLQYMQQSLYGIRGVVKDAITGEAIVAEVSIDGHDDLNSSVFSSLPMGNYHRLIEVGEWTVTYAKEGYVPETFTLNLADKYSTVVQDVFLLPEDVVGIHTPTDVVSVRVAPNPASTHLDITTELPTHAHISLKLYQTNGQLAMTQHNWVASDVLHLDIAHLTGGVYFLVVENDQQQAIYAEKIMVVR